MSHILLVEHEQSTLIALKKLLHRHQYTTSEASTVQEVINQHDLTNYTLIISALRLRGAPGTELISLAGDVPVLIMTNFASLKSAVETMRMGAVDYIPKPIDERELLSIIDRILELPDKPRPQASIPKQGMVGNCPAIMEAIKVIHKVATTDATVLIQGETGTGKELAASAIHNQSQRANNALICVNCAAIPETLIEAELFGHEKGAFTGATEARKGLVAAAHKGTLFLDEIGELPLEAQARLLRVIQQKEVRPLGSVNSRNVDVRLVAATHRNLKQLCEQGRFREDLYYRINVVNLPLPPLRDRGEDILEIADVLLKKQGSKLGKKGLRLAPDAIEAILQYNWPGNIRELENSLERATILCDEDHEITKNLLGISLDNNILNALNNQPGLASASDWNTPHQIASNPPTDAALPNRPTEPNSNTELSLEDYFKQYVLKHQGRMSETALAKQLGISRKCLWERRQKLGIPRKKQPKT